MSTSFIFPYQFEVIGNRRIPYPVVPVTLRTHFGKKSFSFFFDSGADLTSLPNYMLKRLSLGKKSLVQKYFQGAGKKPIKVWETKINIGINDREFQIDCVFTDNDKTPFLLGKLGVFDHYNICLDNDKNQTILTSRH